MHYFSYRILLMNNNLIDNTEIIYVRAPMEIFFNAYTEKLKILLNVKITN